ncbi:HYC_CC_PP family protein [Albibacterium indicum]|uniref:HYC_CC_PP family protein n=1 Tax=Albibacterium indicum TaxID=2292082 RepID=UPI000E500A38|nr:hypothetical protein [Pedobacter indicus]
MKQLFVIFLSSLYLVLTTGFTQTVHVCKEMMTKPLSVMTEQWEVNKACPFCSSVDIATNGKKDGCCEEASKTIKIDESLKKETNYSFSIKSSDHAAPTILGTIFDFTFVNDKEDITFLRVKSPIGDNPLYILHCVYRI